MGFFTGTEPDPKVPNSKCVMYFPDVREMVENIIKQLNITSLLPYNALQLVDDSATLLTRYAQWMKYCIFATLFTRLDNTFETFEGLTTAFYRIILNYSTVLVKIGDFSTSMAASNCRGMFQAVGEIFKLVFQFEVPEDIQ